MEEDHSPETAQKPKRKVNVKCFLAAEAVILIVVILLVWGFFSLPAVFYLGRPANVNVSKFLLVIWKYIVASVSMCATVCGDWI